MKNKLSILLGMMVLGSIIINVREAKAIIYGFNDFNPSGNVTQDTASGFFEINDLNNDGIVDFTSSEFVDANIEIFDSAGDFVIGGGLEILVDNNIAGVTVNDELLDFSTATSGQLSFRDGLVDVMRISPDLGFEVIAGPNFGVPCCTLTATVAPVAVPFEASPTLGFLIVGGIWGVSRLRKRMIARQSANQKLG